MKHLLITILLILFAAVDVSAQQPQGIQTLTLFGGGAPSSTLAGTVGTHYIDQLASNTYICTTVTLTPTVSSCNWVLQNSSGGTPGGSNTQVQYNNSSAFGGITNLTSNGTNPFFTAIAAPASPSAGFLVPFEDSTDLRFHDKNASGTIGTTVVSDTGASNNFLTAISSAGVISKAQPAFSNLSGTIAQAQISGHTVSLILDCAAASASGTAYTCSTSPTFTPADGDAVLFEADVANTGAATLNVNSSSAAPIKKQGGATALVANDILAGQDVDLIFDGTNWQMQGQIGNAGGGAVSSVFTRTGAVVAAANDYTLDLIGNLAASKTFANGNFPLVFNSATTTGSQTAVSMGETTAAIGAGDIQVGISTLSTSTAVPLQVTQGAGPSGAAAPQVLSVAGGAGGAAANATAAGNTGAATSIVSGNGSAGGATSGTGGTGGALTLTAGNGGNATGGSTNGGGGAVTITSGAVGTGGSGGSNGSIILKTGASTALTIAGTTFQLASGAVFNSATTAGSVTVQGGQNASASTAIGSLTLQGGNQTGAGGAGSKGGFVLVQGGNNAATNAASLAGGVTIEPGISTGATQGLQGLLDLPYSYVKGATVTQWNVECFSAAMTVTDCGASPVNWVGIAKVVNANTAYVVQMGQIAVNSSNTAIVGDNFCAGSTAGKGTDNGVAACALGSQIGIVAAISGAFTFGDGTTVTASTTLPIVQISRD